MTLACVSAWKLKSISSARDLESLADDIFLPVFDGLPEAAAEPPIHATLSAHSLKWIGKMIEALKVRHSAHAVPCADFRAPAHDRQLQTDEWRPIIQHKLRLSSPD
jgi:hypothetical protein